MKRNPKAQRGATLTAHLVGTTIAALAASVVSPALDAMLQARELEAAAAMLRTDLQLARSAAVARQEPVYLALQTQGESACYVVHTGRAGACRCTGGVAGTKALETRCDAGAEALRAESWPEQRVTLGGADRNILFDGRLGTVTPTATIGLQNQRSQQIRVIVNIMGRVRLCSPSDGLPHVPRC